jgi:retron-type reverse transcriptase
VQYAIYNKIYDIFDRGFIEHSYACRKNYGTHKAAEYAQWALRYSAEDSYYLKLDIKKYFFSINHEILESLLNKKIKDASFIKIMMLFVKNPRGIGVPMGNLLSQLFALVYLNPLDHFIKKGIKGI